MPSFKYRDPGTGNWVYMPLLVPAGVDEVWVHNDQPTDPNVQLWVDLDASSTASDPYTTVPLPYYDQWRYYGAPYDDCTLTKFGSLVVAGGGIFQWTGPNYTVPAGTFAQYALIPVGYRPAKTVLTHGRSGATEGTLRHDIGTDGVVKVQAGPNGWPLTNGMWVGIGGLSWRV